MFLDPRKNFRDDMVEREGGFTCKMVSLPFYLWLFWGVDQGRFGGDLRCVWGCGTGACAGLDLGCGGGMGGRVLRIGDGLEGKMKLVYIGV